MSQVQNSFIIVSTEDSRDDILRAGNSAAWSINPKWHKSLRLLLCVRRTAEPGQRRAFLLCEIDRIVEDKGATERSGRTKYALEFKRYADVDFALEWKGQNPVRVTNTEDAALRRHKLPSEDAFLTAKERDPNFPYSYTGRSHSRASPEKGLSAAEAKRALAAHYRVPEEAITISINYEL